MSSFDDNDNNNDSYRFQIGIIGDIQYCDKDDGSDHSGIAIVIIIIVIIIIIIGIIVIIIIIIIIIRGLSLSSLL